MTCLQLQQHSYINANSLFVFTKDISMAPSTALCKISVGSKLISVVETAPSGDKSSDRMVYYLQRISQSSTSPPESYF